MIELALKRISELSPSPLPNVDLPPLPELGAVAPLAEIAHGDPAPLLEMAGLIASDEETVNRVLAEAKAHCTAAGEDLLGIGLELMGKALPISLGLLAPNPGIQAAARASLQALAAQHVALAMARVQRLVQELVAAAEPLLPIAEREVYSAVGETATPAEGGPAHAVKEPEDTDPEPAPTLMAPSATSGQQSTAQGEAAVAAAKSQLGKPYVWGGTGEGGFDCSGLTQWAWRQAGIELPRTADAQTVGRQISAEELQPGDLVVWDGHVAMYSGNGEMVEAGSPVQTSALRTSNLDMAFKGFWRPTG